MRGLLTFEVSELHRELRRGLLLTRLTNLLAHLRLSKGLESGQKRLALVLLWLRAWHLLLKPREEHLLVHLLLQLILALQIKSYLVLQRKLLRLKSRKQLGTGQLLL